MRGPFAWAVPTLRQPALPNETAPITGPPPQRNVRWLREASDDVGAWGRLTMVRHRRFRNSRSGRKTPVCDGLCHPMITTASHILARKTLELLTERGCGG